VDNAHADLKALFEMRAEEIRAKDIAGLISPYAPDVVYFDWSRRFAMSARQRCANDSGIGSRDGRAALARKRAA
jgi:ketosteroid isomerase-like protein